MLRIIPTGSLKQYSLGQSVERISNNAFLLPVKGYNFARYSAQRLVERPALPGGRVPSHRLLRLVRCSQKISLHVPERNFDNTIPVGVILVIMAKFRDIFTSSVHLLPKSAARYSSKRTLLAVGFVLGKLEIICDSNCVRSSATIGCLAGMTKTGRANIGILNWMERKKNRSWLFIEVIFLTFYKIRFSCR